MKTSPPVTSTSLSMRSYDVLGVPVTATQPHRAAEAIEAWAKDDIGRFVCFRDVASLMAIRDSVEMRDLHHQAAMVAPDGLPLVIVGKLKNRTVRRTCGPDFLDLVVRRSIKSGLSHYFYGGREGVAEELARILGAKYPGIRIAGFECPPFRPLTAEEDDALVSRIKASRADVVWVGISSPKQDVWMRDHYQRLPQTLLGVGAAFDFHTGVVKRAPVWMQICMLEWCYRLYQEPRRLYRRYLFAAPRFVALIVAEAIRDRIGSVARR